MICLSEEVEKAQIEKEIPSHKVSMEKQVDILKGFATIYEKKKRATYKDVAPIVNVHPNDVSACLKFWKSVGLLEEQNGGYKASAVTLEFARKIEWGTEDEAWSMIGRHLRNAWFTEHLVMVFRIKKSLTEEELLNSLGSASGATKKDKNVVTSLKILQKLLEHSKIILKDKAGDYVLNPELVQTYKRETIEVPEDRDLIKLRIGKEVYVVSIKELQEFVKKQGRKLAEKEIKIE